MIISIDPGLHGAAAFLSDTGIFQDVIDLPIIRDGKMGWVDTMEFWNSIMFQKRGGDAITAVVLERVGARPGQASGATLNYGIGFGSILGIIGYLGSPLHLVTPAQWKGKLGLTRDKNQSLDKARRLFPAADLARKKDEGRAEAILIGYWYLTFGPGSSKK